MQIKKYRAPSLAEALQQVRHELGEQALILDTKRIPGSGLGSVLGRRAVEVTAARDAHPRPAATPGAEKTRPAPRRSFAERAYTQPEEGGAGTTSERGSLAALREDLQQVKANLSRLATAVRPEEKEIANPILRLFQQRLRERGVDPGVAGSLVQVLNLQINSQDAADPQALRRSLGATLEKFFSFSPAPRRRRDACEVIALVGPTGVGKTTTIAKLAANAKIHERARVGLLSVDTYRLAAIDQLRSFTHIADMPLQIAYTREEIAAALQRLSTMDLVFVDTAGRSPQHAEHLEQLNDFIRVIHPDQIHLVMSATTKPGDLRTITQQFAVTRFDHVLITKIDETTDLASLLNLQAVGPLRLSYFGTGQNIPDDIVRADVLQFSDWILSGVGL